MKHAYLIIAHKDDYTFRTLLDLVDDERNDIFIHMDKKNKQYQFKDIANRVRKSNIYQVENRIDVVWGDYSQIATELALLELSTTTGHYDYYHLLSGEDLPIKTQDYIHHFFEQNKGKEFIRFENQIFLHSERVAQYHFAQRLIGKPDLHPHLYSLEHYFVKLQKIIGIKRNRYVQFQKGANWFSITDELAREVVSRKSWIKKVFKFTECCDEVFLQTIVNQSKFKERLYHTKFDNDIHSIMRLIDWNRGNPYIFKYIDKSLLKQTDMLFARKFNCEVDRKIIEFIAQSLAK